MSQKTVQENTLVHKLEIMYHVSWKPLHKNRHVGAKASPESQEINIRQIGPIN